MKKYGIVKSVSRNREHLCREIFCKICKEHCPAYRRRRQEKVTADGSLLHEPNLCVFRQCCDIGINVDIEIREKCGIRLQIIQCSDPISSFMHHVLNLRNILKNVVVLAHSGGGFDHQFILNYILTKSDLKPKLIMRGTKLVSMVINKIQFLDSLIYFPMALSKLPKAFGFSELKKGYFPHLFNKVKNQK